MTGKRLAFTAVMFALLLSVVAAHSAVAAQGDGRGRGEKFQVVRGVVESAGVDNRTGRNMLTVRNKQDVASTHDITGARIVGVNDEPVLETGDALRGKKAEIVFNDDAVVFVRILPTLPE